MVYIYTIDSMSIYKELLKKAAFCKDYYLLHFSLFGKHKLDDTILLRIKDLPITGILWKYLDGLDIATKKFFRLVEYVSQKENLNIKYRNKNLN